MSKSIVLIVPADVTLSHIGTSVSEQSIVERIYTITEGPSPRFQVQGSSNGLDWYVDIMELPNRQDALREYLEWDLPTSVKQQLEKETFYSISYNSLTSASFIIRDLLSTLIVSHPDIWLDNDYGELIPGQTVLNEFKRNPQWDWHTYRKDERKGALR